jgi:DNA-binding response OmpR family regulator
MLAKVLVRSGHQVDSASSCAEAKQLFKANAYDVLILDMMLPDGDGNHLLKELRETRKVPAIALTGLMSDTDGNGSAGFVAHITKPFDMPDLEKAIQDIHLPASVD